MAHNSLVLRNNYPRCRVSTKTTRKTLSHFGKVAVVTTCTPRCGLTKEERYPHSCSCRRRHGKRVTLWGTHISLIIQPASERRSFVHGRSVGVGRLFYCWLPKSHHTTVRASNGSVSYGTAQNWTETYSSTDRKMTNRIRRACYSIGIEKSFHL